MQSSNYHPQRRRDSENKSIQRERRVIQFSPEEAANREQQFLNRAEARHRYEEQSRRERQFHRDRDEGHSRSASASFETPERRDSQQRFYDYEENRQHEKFASPDFNTGYGHDANRPLPRDFVSSSNYEEDRRMHDMAEQDWTDRDFHPAQKDYHRTDSRIQEELSHVLAQHRSVDARDIDVEVSEGVVTLTGFVPDRKMRYIAEDVSINCFGVIDVNNNIKVHRTSEAEARFGGRRTFGPTSPRLRRTGS
ncbi:BON domain-containing protein [Bdellovibrio sp. HCB274]|uniref:BON domain-containing protein n=1 Tax=Bdellovibrio sp. HCB274 TaxID=3394361 RepID=UPI0039B51E0A